MTPRDGGTAATKVPPHARPAAASASSSTRKSLEQVLAWDGLVKETRLRPGETQAFFTFAFTNTSPTAVTVNAVRTSCGCTTAQLPPLPWTIPAGIRASFDVVMDVRGKRGVFSKTVTVETSAGVRQLTTRAALPGAPAGAQAMAERARNLQVALADRQAVLEGDCVVCHVTPGVGKQGEELYEAVCGVCHEAEHRASMVPDLRAIARPFRAVDWEKVIRHGKPNSLMPAFASPGGGPLREDQIESLVEYLAGASRAERLPEGEIELPPPPNSNGLR